jgi:hypothetical protein
MRRGARRWGAAAILAGAAMVLAACDGGTVTVAATSAAPSRTAATASGPARSYLLYTHCGIDEARIGNRYYRAVHPLSDGQGNPPAGWGNPYQRGTMTLLSHDEALFRDDAGHQVLFRLRPGARSFQHVCS